MGNGRAIEHLYRRHDQWNGLTDVTDARMLARQVVWASTSSAGQNEAFNIVNGNVFYWKWLWPRISLRFSIEAAPYPGRPTSLVESRIERLASAWHTDADLSRPVECVTDMSKSRQTGFTDYQFSPDSFFDVFTRLRAEHFIP